MDKIYIKKMLQEFLGDRFEFHPKFYEEFADLVKKSGQEKKVIKAFVITRTII